MSQEWHELTSFRVISSHEIIALSSMLFQGSIMREAKSSGSNFRMEENANFMDISVKFPCSMCHIWSCNAFLILLGRTISYYDVIILFSTYTEQRVRKKTLQMQRNNVHVEGPAQSLKGLYPR